MAGYYRLQPEDLLPSDRELDLMKTAQHSEQAKAVGGTVGSGLGMLVGVPPQIGSAAGEMVAGMLSEPVSDMAQQELDLLEQERQEKITAQQMRDEALRRLLETA
jgi:hypothetical protein